MCVISMIGDYYQQKWNQPAQGGASIIYQSEVTKIEFEELKKQVLEMKSLLIAAKEYDKKNNEPDCEKEEKVAVLKAVAKTVDISLNEIFPDKL